MFYTIQCFLCASAPFFIPALASTSASRQRRSVIIVHGQESRRDTRPSHCATVPTQAQLPNQLGPYHVNTHSSHEDFPTRASIAGLTPFSFHENRLTMNLTLARQRHARHRRCPLSHPIPQLGINPIQHAPDSVSCATKIKPLTIALVAIVLGDALFGHQHHYSATFADALSGHPLLTFPAKHTSIVYSTLILTSH